MAESSDLCPICGDILGDAAEIGYTLDDQRVQTCGPCRAAIMQLFFESKLGMRSKFWGYSGNPEKIRNRVHAEVLSERGLNGIDARNKASVRR